MLIKQTIALFSFVFLAQTAGAEMSRLTCFTAPATTTFAVAQNSGGYLLTVTHHNGTEFMPIYNGIATIHDLKTLTEQGQLLAKMGAEFQVQLDSCTKTNDDVYCVTRNPTKIGELEVRSASFGLRKRRVTSAVFDETSYRANFYVGVGHTSYTIPMDYPLSDCHFSF